MPRFSLQMGNIGDKMQRKPLLGRGSDGIGGAGGGETVNRAIGVNCAEQDKVWYNGA